MKTTAPSPSTAAAAPAASSTGPVASATAAAPAATVAKASAAPAPAEANPAQAQPQERYIPSGQQSTPRPFSVDEARREFFKARPAEAKGEPATNGTPPPGDGQAPGATPAVSAAVPPADGAAAAGDEDGLPPFQEADATPPEEGTGTFTPPPWVNDIADPESREKALNFAKGLFERSHKERTAAAKAKQEAEQAKAELAEVKSKVTELETTPVSVIPGLDLPEVRTLAELEQFVSNAPTDITTATEVWHNCQKLLTALEQADGSSVNMFGTTWEDNDRNGVEAEQAQAMATIQNLQESLKKAPARRAHLEKQQTSTEIAKGFYADLKNDKSALALAVRAKLKADPALAASTEAQLLVADSLFMEKVRKGEFKLVKASAPKAAPPKTSDGKATAEGGTPPPPRAGAAANAAQAEELRKLARLGDRNAQEQLRNLALKTA